MNDLFSTYTLKGRVTKNRLVVPPMVCFGYSPDGYVSDRHLDHYERMAAGGNGIVIVEATCVSKNGRLDSSELGIWDDSFIPRLSELASVIKKHGALSMIQIHHAGIKNFDKALAVCPSEYEDIPALTIPEIEEITADFVKAAVRAKQAGFDGVELHGCHGYLICEFLSPVTNNRDDVYGDDRTKFAVDIIKKVRCALGEDMIIGIRMGGNDPDMRTATEYAKVFEKNGVDIIHVSTGFKDYSPEDLYYEENEYYNWIVRTGIIIKRFVRVPVIVVNGVRTPEQAQYIISENLSDFVAVGKAMLVDPEWAPKMQRGETPIKCRSCKRCTWFERHKKPEDRRCPARKA